MLEASDYSVWGGRTQVLSCLIPGGCSLRDRFTGKEDQEPDFGVPYTDFGARIYSPKAATHLVRGVTKGAEAARAVDRVADVGKAADKALDAAKGGGKANSKVIEAEGCISNIVQSESSSPGSYSIGFESGKYYHGKGPVSRMKQSDKQHSVDNNDPVVSYDCTPSKSNFDAFVDEAQRIRRDGGIKGNNYNKINSPGEKYLKKKN